MKLPSDKYFFWVDSEETLNSFKATGQMYELEPFAPDTWQDHLEMLEYKKNLEDRGEEGWQNTTNIS